MWLPYNLEIVPFSFYPEEMKTCFHIKKKKKKRNVHSHFIHNSPELEKIQILFNSESESQVAQSLAAS